MWNKYSNNSFAYHFRSALYHEGSNFTSRSYVVSLIEFLKALSLGILRGLILRTKTDGDIIISSAYGKWNQEIFKHTEIKVINAPWDIKRKGEYNYSISLVFLSLLIKHLLALRNIRVLNSNMFRIAVGIQHKLFEEYFTKINNIKLIIVPNDVGYLERLIIDLAKRNSIKTMILCHGIHTRFGRDVDTKTDYVATWSEHIKYGYIERGFEAQKVINIGHYFYGQNTANKIKVNGIKNVLVLTKALTGATSSDEVILEDKFLALDYIHDIVVLLKSLSIDVVLRCHPSENILWYRDHLNREDIKYSSENLSTLLGNTDLVIGPISTVILDSLNVGVPYLLHEPIINGKDIFGYELPYPLNGGVIEIPVSKNINELRDSFCESKFLTNEALPFLANKVNTLALKRLMND